jgi:hypothetical protein
MTDWTRDYAFDQLLAKLDVIRGVEGQNEDTTRMRAIDTMIFDVLGWDKLDLETEKYVRAIGFADYAFAHGSSVCLILEAKKSGEYFVLPDREYRSEPVGFALLAQECKEAEVAMIQAAGYAALESTRYVAISNGHQWILAIPYVPQQPLRHRSVFVFESLDAIHNRFDHFFKCFGPEGIRSNWAASQLMEVRKAPAPAKLSASITNYPVPANRNQLSNEVGYIIDLVFTEVEHHEASEEFLRECYIPPPASADGISLAKELLTQRRANDEQVRTEAIDTGDVTQLIATYSPERPIVVLGRIGHGKSTFLRFLRLVKAKDDLNRYIQIDIDFLHHPPKKDDVPTYVFAEVARQLYEKYAIDITDDKIVRAALWSEVQRFRTSPKGKQHADDPTAYLVAEVARLEELQKDSHGYLTKVFYHLRNGRGYSLAVFFDNLDRRDDIQEDAFLRASAIAWDWECLVFVCLRPSTFHKSCERGVLDTVAPKTISVASPPSHILLKKRFHYASEIAAGTKQAALPRAVPGKDISFHLPKVAALLQCCEDSFFRSRKLTDVFDAVANGNVRKLLTYIREFLTSMHLDTEKIVERIPDGYRIPDHEAVRALLYGDFLHFDPEHSPFANLFDISRADRGEHFSRFLALHFLNRVSTNFGYCDADELMQYLCQIGFTDEHVRTTIKALESKQCCEYRLPGHDMGVVDAQIRCTSLGRYHICHLAPLFQYMDAITIDTPIIDTDVRHKIHDVMTIKDRLDRCTIFINYLDTCSESIQDGDAVGLWKDTYQGVQANISGIHSSI